MEGEISSLMTRENIYRMLAGGFHFGSHSRTHKKLTVLSIEAAREEIGKSKEELENLLQQPVRSFAYPYGCFDRGIIEMVNEAGYGTARTVHMGNIHFKEDLNQLRCIKINGLTSKRRFGYCLSRFYHMEQIYHERRRQKKASIEGHYSWQPEKEGNIL